MSQACAQREIWAKKIKKVVCRGRSQLQRARRRLGPCDLSAPRIYRSFTGLADSGPVSGVRQQGRIERPLPASANADACQAPGRPRGWNAARPVIRYGTETTWPSGGGCGIRTHGTLSRTHAFQACALNRSANPPARRAYSRPPEAQSIRHASIFSAARKALCGISTFPNWRIRFLPSFCLSSSLRLRLMSPP